MRLYKTIFYLSIAGSLLAGCRTTFSPTINNETVQLPFMKNSANECYYVDEFMPIPDSMVSGKVGALNLRYYTYKYANYKDWKNLSISLSFYSSDGRCWSLFEEYYSKDL